MISAIILAAGEGKRMGRLKQLLPWGESTILETVIENVRGSKYLDDQIRVVIGAGAGEIKPRLERSRKKGLVVLENPAYARGMLSSIRRGIIKLPPQTKYLAFFLGDQPLITPDLIDRIIGNFLEKRPEALIPVFAGEKGHPVIVDIKLLPEINELTGPGGLRSLFSKYPEKAAYLPFDDPEITIDLDYYWQYRHYLNSRDVGG